MAASSSCVPPVAVLFFSITALLIILASSSMRGLYFSLAADTASYINSPFTVTEQAYAASLCVRRLASSIIILEDRPIGSSGKDVKKFSICAIDSRVFLSVEKTASLASLLILAVIICDTDCSIEISVWENFSGLFFDEAIRYPSVLSVFNWILIMSGEFFSFGACSKSSDSSASLRFRLAMLVMTATPIPRTLFMALYGDLDLSVIRELPPGRLPVITAETDERRAFDAVNEEVSAGRQVYVVYPAIDETEHSDIKSIKAEYERVKKMFSGRRVEFIHGRMKGADKRRIMEDFASGMISVLIATQVIEVGIDVPCASLIVINNAERFGLASLHQLRGRVGRGQYKSRCLLVCGSRTGEAAQRMRAMTECASGFELSEKDIYLRGAGEIFATEQHGDMGFRLADISRDAKILEQAIADKDEILSIDPGLKAAENAGLRSQLERQYARRWNLIDLS